MRKCKNTCSCGRPEETRTFRNTGSSTEDIIFMLGIVISLALMRSRYEYIEGNRIPVLFKNKPTLFHGFLIALNFGFTAAVVTMSLRAKSPTLAKFCRRLAIVCVAVAVVLMSFSVLLPAS